MKNKPGWYNESRRHSLASKGIETGRKTYEPAPPRSPIPKKQQEGLSNADELTLFTENDGTIYRTMRQKTEEKLAKEISNGEFKYQDALGDFRVIAKAGALAYEKQLPNSREFSAEDMTQTAKNLLNQFVVENAIENPPKVISINAKRWLDRPNGNTYHSVEVSVDGKFVGKANFVYGYDEHYLDTAHNILQMRGYFPLTQEKMSSGMDKDFYDFMQDRRNNPTKYVTFVADVSRRGDL